MGLVTTYDVPTSLSPSRVESFTSCPLAFRFVNIEKLDDPPSVHTTRGSLVHRALELAFLRPADERDAAAVRGGHRAGDRRVPRRSRLHAPRASARSRRPRSSGSAASSSPTTCGWRTRSRCRPIGLELMLSTQIGDLTLRGIIDRLELRRRRARRHRLQDRARPVGELGAAQPRRRALLLVPLRGGVRTAARRRSG